MDFHLDTVYSWVIFYASASEYFYYDDSFLRCHGSWIYGFTWHVMLRQMKMRVVWFRFSLPVIIVSISILYKSKKKKLLSQFFIFAFYFIELIFIKFILPQKQKQKLFSCIISSCLHPHHHNYQSVKNPFKKNYFSSGKPR